MKGLELQLMIGLNGHVVRQNYQAFPQSLEK